MTDDRRLIEDYLPIQAIGAEASREKSVRKGHISTLHLWWARRPLVACRAAVYAALVPASQFVPNAGSDEKKKSLGRANAAKFIERLCQYPGSPNVIAEAQGHILNAHAERLTRQTGKSVTVKDIMDGHAPRPKVLDMFAGGGAIPLEALRLGCEAYALDLNPVAHIIELCTLVYPQKYGKPELSARGMIGTKNSKGENTWGGLAEEVRYWGNQVLQKVKAEIGYLYPPIPDPDAEPKENGAEPQTVMGFANADQKLPKVTGSYLTPVAYLWTRTVRCKNPACGATVPLVKRTWLCKNKDRCVAIRMVAPSGEKKARFEIVEARIEGDLGFDPEGFSKGGNATCPYCGTVADIDYIKAESCGERMGAQLMSVVAQKTKGKGKRYLPVNETLEQALDKNTLRHQADRLAAKLGINVPDEPLEANPRSFDVQHFGYRKWADVFSPRQLLAMTAFTGSIRASFSEVSERYKDADRSKGVTLCLSMALGRLADYCTSFCTWQPEFIKNTFNSPGLPMVMDYAETNPIANTSGSWVSAIEYVARAIQGFTSVSNPAWVERGSAVDTGWSNELFDAIVTDPPYYDSRSYSNLSDHFYVWHKRAIGPLFREHFASTLTPKKNEAIAAPYRHCGNRTAADKAYEGMMQSSFGEARRLLKAGSPMICVYAHKTTIGWATLISALMKAGFAVTEAWPVEMERKSRQNAQETSALASSIFLVAHKRDGFTTGSYEDEVRSELDQIVRERVDTLWRMGITGADLIIAAVGAGLRALTRFARVEYANGEEVPAEKFLAEVEGGVLETLLEKIFGMARSGVSAVDAPSRFYVLWRFAYCVAELDAGEAIVFTMGQHVELDGPLGLSTGNRALVEKKKGKYRVRDFAERGQNEKLGLPNDDGETVPLIDVLHRALWLMEHEPRKLSSFLDEAHPNREQLRLVAQALAGAGLSGKSPDESANLISTTTSEQTALGKLLANWRALVTESLFDAGSKNR
jgi:putative DNA methylase